MEQNEVTPTRALAAQIKAEKGAQGLSVKRLSELSGIPVGTLNRMLSSEPRDIFMSQITELAKAFGMTAAELVAAAEARYERMVAAAAVPDELAERRSK